MAEQSDESKPDDPTPEADGGSSERIQDLDIAYELKQSYLRYAMSVIVDRALPDVRDGLKPSQRRILVAMGDLNLGPSRKTIKCAKVVGETMGSYHPHGDQAIYPTLVRMAQPFNMSQTLVQGQGNFGSIDRDPPASMRYTECRMTHAATEMLDDLDKETVDFRPNYDESTVEPTVLPGRFPNLLINGGSGIAVAMASSFAPHNPTEVANAILAYLDDPEITIEGLMEHLPGPDLPTASRICGRTAIHQAYTTGRGAIEMRAVCEIRDQGKKNAQILVTEIPYQVNKAALVRKIADLVRSDRVPGISDIREESAKDVRIVITVKRGEDPEIVLNQLYKYSALRETLSVNMIALVDGRPVMCDLKRLISEYVRHRREVITRRTRFLLRKAEARDHLVEGLLKALDLIDEIVALIRASADPKEAKAGLIGRFAFSTAQAEAILQMRLQRLTGLQRQELEAEHAELRAKIEDYNDILARDERIVGILRDDMEALKARFPQARRTRIEESVEDFTSLDLITPENVVVTLSHEGYIKRTELGAYRTQRRGGKGIKGTQSKEGDFVEHLVVANTHDVMLFFTDSGRVFRDHVAVLPDLGRYAKGRAVVNLLNLGPDERIKTIQALRAHDDEVPDTRSVLFATRLGLIKRTRVSDFQNIHSGGIIALGLRDGDALIGTLVVEDHEQVVLVTAQGMAVRFPVEQARAMGRTARGVRGIKLKPGDHVVDMARAQDVVRDASDAEQPGTLLTVFAGGYAKRTPFEEYRVQSRGGLGLRNVSATGVDRNGEVVAARSVLDGDEIILITEGGKSIRMTVSGEQFRPIGRATAGVRAIDLPEGDRLVSMAWVRPEDDEAAEAADVESADAESSDVESPDAGSPNETGAAGE